MVTPHLTLKDIPLVVINHIYMEIGMFPKAIVSGGTGSYYGADNIWIIGRQQDKVDDEIAGYHFVINIEKSRFVREKSKIPITISYESGINRWSGLLDLALEGGYIVKPKNGWYSVVDKSTGEMGGNLRAAQIVDNKDLWMKMFKETDFADFIKKQYALSAGNLMDQEDISEELAGVTDED
jgi:hypothetical protein